MIYEKSVPLTIIQVSGLTVYTLGFALDNKWKILRKSLFRYTIGVNKIQQNRLFKKENDDYENKKITLDDFDWRDGGKSAGRLWL